VTLRFACIDLHTLPSLNSAVWREAAQVRFSEDALLTDSNYPRACVSTTVEAQLRTVQLAEPFNYNNSREMGQQTEIRARYDLNNKIAAPVTLSIGLVAGRCGFKCASVFREVLGPAGLPNPLRASTLEIFPSLSQGMCPPLGRSARGGGGFMRLAVTRSALFSTFFITLLICGCGHGGLGPVTAVTVSPTSVSLSPGDVVLLTPKATDKAGNTIAGATFTYAVTGGVVTVSNSGLVCGGTWDSLTSPVVCNKGSLGSAAIKVTATGNGGTATSADIAVAVHQKIDAVRVAAVPNPAPSCISQGSAAPANTEQFQATALSNDAAYCAAPPAPQAPQAPPCPVANPGTFTFASSQTTVGSISSTQPANQDPSEITITAGNPGVSNITASVAGVTSSPAVYETCPAASIALHLSGSAATSVSFTSTTGTQALQADVLDTHGVPFTNIALDWHTSQSHAASVSSTGVISAASPGASSITASCSSTACNVGVGAVFSNVVTATVTGASSQTVYVTTSAAPASGAGNTLIPIDNNTAGTAITLATGATINSLVIDPAGAKGYLGSNQGLIILTTSANTVAAPVGGTPGKVLSVSPDSNRVIISDMTNRLVYVFNAAASAVEAQLAIPDAVSAAWSPDSQRVYIVDGSSKTVTVYNPAAAAHTIGSSANDASVLASGHLAMIANSGDDLFAVCNNALVGHVNAGTPLLISTIPNGTGGIDVTTSSIEQFDISFQNLGGGCPPALTTNPIAPTSYSFTGVSTFTPQQLLVTPDSKKAVVISNNPGILLYSIGATASAGSAAPPIALASGATPACSASQTTDCAGVTLDSTTLYVGGSDKTVHRIDLTANGGNGSDAQQITVPFTPDLVAVRGK